MVDRHVGEATAARRGEWTRDALLQSRFEQSPNVIADGTAVVDGHQLGQKRVGSKRVVQRQTPMQRRQLPGFVLLEVEFQLRKMAGDKRSDQGLPIAHLLIERPDRKSTRLNP